MAIYKCNCCGEEYPYEPVYCNECNRRFTLENFTALPQKTAKVKTNWTKDEVLAFGLDCVNLGMSLQSNPYPRLSEKSGKEYYYEWSKTHLK